MRSKTGPTAVVDTNVWISAALSPHGAPAQVLRAILLRGLPVFSEATFAELASRLWKHKFDRYIDIETRKLNWKHSIGAVTPATTPLCAPPWQPRHRG